MRRLLTSVVLGLAAAVAVHGQGSGRPRAAAVSGGDQLLYIGTYAGTIQIFDEATFEKIGDIPLTTGFPRSLTLSESRQRFYVLDATTEKVEVVDIATRASLAVHPFSQGNTKTRVRTLAVDPLERFLILLSRSATKLIDRWEIGPIALSVYDLAQKKVTRTIPWPKGEERENINMRFSPDGKLLYLFGDDVSILETTSFTEVDTWALSRPLEPGLGRVSLGQLDDFNDDPGFATGLFTVQDPVQHRRIMGIGRIDLVGKHVDFTPLGPSENVGFVMAPDRKRAWGLMQQIGQYEFWSFDVAQRKLMGRTPFSGRPRMALRVSSNGKLLYVYQAGATIDLYDSTTFKLLRTVDMSADQTTNLFVLPRPKASKTDSASR